MSGICRRASAAGWVDVVVVVRGAVATSGPCKARPGRARTNAGRGQKKPTTGRDSGEGVGSVKADRTGQDRNTGRPSCSWLGLWGARESGPGGYSTSAGLDMLQNPEPIEGH